MAVEWWSGHWFSLWREGTLGKNCPKKQQRAYEADWTEAGMEEREEPATSNRERDREEHITHKYNECTTPTQTIIIEVTLKNSSVHFCLMRRDVMCFFDIFIVSTPSGVILVRTADLDPPQIYTRLSIMHPEHLHCTAHTQRERCKF